MAEKKDPHEGKFMATVRVGEKGQIVIPKGARDLFNIQPGDTLLLLADVNQGIAIVRNDLFKMFASEIMRVQDDPQEGNE
jgi:AbrB family looped-hinge helix DNA binding protein